MVGLQVTDDNYHDIIRKLISDDRKVSKGINSQNLPSKGDGVRVRNAFKPREGYIYLSADLSQVEPRIMAAIMYQKYGDGSLRQIFIDGRDLYTSMAMLVFGLEEKYCVDKAYDPTGTFQPRKMMKTGVLAKSYDQKVDSFCTKMGVSQEIGEMFYRKFDDSFPSFSVMVRDIREGMKRNGYVETLFGRKRRFPLYNIVAAEVARNEGRLTDLYIERKRLQSKIVKTEEEQKRLAEVQREIDELRDKKGMLGYWERAAFNAVIQGTGADILKLNMIELAKVCRERGWEFNASIHDEVKISVKKEDLTPEVTQLLTDIMTQTVHKYIDFPVPLKSDTVIEPAWMHEYSPDEWDFENCRPIVEKYDERGRVFKDYKERLKQEKERRGLHV